MYMPVNFYINKIPPRPLSPHPLKVDSLLKLIIKWRHIKFFLRQKKSIELF
jgi:hypothetical protein